MAFQPFQKSNVIHITGSDAQNGCNQVFIFIGHHNIVDVQKYQHGMGANALIAIHKGMIVDKSVAQPGRLFQDRRVQLLSSEGLQR